MSLKRAFPGFWVYGFTGTLAYQRLLQTVFETRRVLIGKCTGMPLILVRLKLQLLLATLRKIHTYKYWGAKQLGEVPMEKSG